MRPVDKAAPAEELSLHELAAKIARETLGMSSADRTSEDASAGVKHVVFVLDDTQYAVPMENVLELQRMPRITPLPSVPDWLRGVTNLGGDVLSVVDLRSRLGLSSADSSVSQRLVVVRSTVEEIATGWIVDRIIGVRRLAMDDRQPSSTLTISAAVRFLNGIVDCEGQLIAVLVVAIQSLTALRPADRRSTSSRHSPWRPVELPLRRSCRRR